MVKALLVSNPNDDCLDDAERYLGNPQILVFEEGHYEVWLKPKTQSDRWLTMGRERLASFGIVSITGFWDGVSFVARQNP